MKNFLIIITLSIAFLSACSKDNTAVSYTPSCNGSVKSYKTDVAPIISASCSGCHQNFGTYSQLASSQSSVRSMIVSGQMPQGGSLTSAQKDAVVCWIDSGAANN